MPQGSSAVRPTNGLYLYLYRLPSMEYLQFIELTVGEYCKHNNELLTHRHIHREYRG